MANREFLDNMKKDERAIDNINSLPPLSALLDYIEKGCQQINEERNFVDYLLSMEKETSLDELIHKFNNIFKLLCNINFKDKRTPKDWYFYKHWTNRNYVEILLCYLNENILSLFKRQGDYSQEQLNTFIINLRDCKNIKKVEQEILKIANIKYNSKQYKLISVRNEINKIRRLYYIDEFNIIESYKPLVGDGYIFDEIDIQIINKNGYSREEIMQSYLLDKRKKKQEVIIVSLLIAFFAIVLILIGIYYSFDIALVILFWVGIFSALTWISKHSPKTQNNDADIAMEKLGDALVCGLGAFFFFSKFMKGK